VKTIRDLIYWQYAKIISESAGAGKRQYGFVMNRFQSLTTGQISWSTAIREYVKERESPDACIYCGSHDQLTLDHLLPRSRGGPDSSDNAVWVCKRCNSAKGDRRLYEWYGLGRRYELPRIAEGKYLKLLYTLHEALHTLDTQDIATLCPRCDLTAKCPEKQRLTVYCLEGLFIKRR
jgi:hypothetical protein